MAKKSFSNFVDNDITNQPVIKSGWQPIEIKKEEQVKVSKRDGMLSLREMFEKDFGSNKKIEEVEVKEELIEHIPQLIEEIAKEAEESAPRVVEEIVEAPKPTSLIDRACLLYTSPSPRD